MIVYSLVALFCDEEEDASRCIANAVTCEA